MNGAVYPESIGPRELQMTFRKQAEQLAVHNTIEPQKPGPEGSHACRATRGGEQCVQCQNPRPEEFCPPHGFLHQSRVLTEKLDQGVNPALPEAQSTSGQATKSAGHSLHCFQQKLIHCVVRPHCGARGGRGWRLRGGDWGLCSQCGRRGSSPDDAPFVETGLWASELPDHVVEDMQPLRGRPSQPGRDADRDRALPAPVLLDAEAVLQPVAGKQIRADLQDLGEARNWGPADMVRGVRVCRSVCRRGYGLALWVGDRVGAGLERGTGWGPGWRWR
jgi:hypothetical protein